MISAAFTLAAVMLGAAVLIVAAISLGWEGRAD